MQSSMSSASTPSAASSPAPQPVKPLPEIVRPPKGKPGKARVWIALILLAAAGMAVYLQTRPQKSATGKGAATITRTAGITIGDVQRTIRVTGTIQAERFAAVMAPQLRGSRSDRYRTYSGSSSSGGGSGSSNSASAAPATPATVSTSASGASSDSSSFTGGS